MEVDDNTDGMELEAGQHIPTRRAKYTIIDKVGQGGFGAVYKVESDPPMDGEKEFAMKVEQRTIRREHSKLNMEVHLLRLMASQSTDKSHFLKIYDKAKKKKFFMIVMTLVGESLAELKRQRSPPIFSLSTIFGVAIQSLEAIEELHKVGFIHRDIKPGNFAVGRAPLTHLIYILDFGMARKYVNEYGEIKAPRERVPFHGTLRYASLSCHRAQELGRKDDCESWLYMIVDCCNKDGLPWQKEKDRKVVQDKKTAARTSLGRIRLFEKMDLTSMSAIMDYIDNLEYADKVDYRYISGVINNAATATKSDMTSPFDWEKSPSACFEDYTTGPSSYSVRQQLRRGHHGVTPT